MELDSDYFRGLVKQLSTSTSTATKDPMNPNDQGCVVDDVRNLTKHGRVVGSGVAHHPQQQQKKQVRRRLHTSRPYQERLLNMAEARKEIVTALKFHRASMKQASERQQQQQQQQEDAREQQQQQITSASLQPSHQQQPSFEQDGRFKSRRNPRTYPSCTNNFPNYNMDDFSSSYLSQPPNSYNWPATPPIASPPSPLLAENPNFILPNQPLGLNLNLNFHDFNKLDATLHLNSSSISSSYSSPTSSSPPLSAVTTDQDVPSVGMSHGEGSSSLVDTIQSSAATWPNGEFHAAMDDEGLAEIRSLGEQHQMEWNDTMSLVKSACWFKFLKSIPEEAVTEGDAYHIFDDETVEFPSWLNANGSCLEQCSEDYFQDSTLPCMDIGDIEIMEEDWLA